MRLRVFLAVAVAALVSLIVLPAASQACNYPTLHPSSSAGPGDTVSYTVGNLDPGATYDIVVAGRAVVSGGSSPSGSFTMPDLGSEPQSVPAQLTVYHDDLAETYTEPVPPRIAYQPPPSSPPPDQQHNPQPGAQPQMPDTAAEPPRELETEASPDREPTERDASSPVATGPGAAGSPMTPALETARVPADTAARSAEARTRGAAQVIEARSSESAGSQALGSPRSASAVVETDPAAMIVIAVAIALIIGSGGALIRAAREPRPSGDGDRAARVAVPVPREVEHDAKLRSLLIEAELQEMIAEARASELLGQQDQPATAERATVP